MADEIRVCACTRLTLGMLRMCVCLCLLLIPFYVCSYPRSSSYWSPRSVFYIHVDDYEFVKNWKVLQDVFNKEQISKVSASSNHIHPHIHHHIHHHTQYHDGQDHCGFFTCLAFGAESLFVDYGRALIVSHIFLRNVTASRMYVLWTKHIKYSTSMSKSWSRPNTKTTWSFASGSRTSLSLDTPDRSMTPSPVVSKPWTDTTRRTNTPAELARPSILPALPQPRLPRSLPPPPLAQPDLNHHVRVCVCDCSTFFLVPFMFLFIALPLRTLIVVQASLAGVVAIVVVTIFTVLMCVLLLLSVWIMCPSLLPLSFSLSLFIFSLA